MVSRAFDSSGKNYSTAGTNGAFDDYGIVVFYVQGSTPGCARVMLRTSILCLLVLFAVLIPQEQFLHISNMFDVTHLPCSLLSVLLPPYRIRILLQQRQGITVGNSRCPHLLRFLYTILTLVSVVQLPYAAILTANGASRPRRSRRGSRDNSFLRVFIAEWPLRSTLAPEVTRLQQETRGG